MLRNVLALASLACSASLCVAVPPGSTAPCSSENATGNTDAATQMISASQNADTSSQPSLANSGVQTKNCQAPDPLQSNATSTAPIFEFSYSPGGSTAQIPDAPSSSKNLLHGHAYGLLGSTLIGAPDVTLRDELPIRDLGASLGGTIGHGTTSYFVSLDDLGFSPQNLLSSLTEIQKQVGIASLPTDANPAEIRVFAARIDHQFGQRDSAYLRFNRDDVHSYSLHLDQNGNPSGLTTNFGVKQQSVAAGNTITISPDTVNETSAQFTARDLQLPAGATDGDLQSRLDTLRHDRVFQAADNIYRQVGGEGLRMGGDFLVNQMNLSFIESSAGRNSFFSQSGRSAGAYVESNRQVRPNLLLTSGIRYQIQELRGFKTDTNNFAPEVGVAWAPSSRTVIRGGVGIYYDQIALPAIAGTDGPGQATNLQASGRFVSRNGPALNQLAGITAESPSMQNSYAEQADLQIEQQIGTKSAVSAESQFIRGVQLALPVYRSISLCASTAACRAGNTFWGQEIGTGAVSSYRGTSVAFTQQPVHWGNYKVSYTFATAQSTGTGENASFIQDQMRRASFTGVLHTSLDPANGVWQYFSHGYMLTGTSDYTTRSEFNGMNFINTNARLSKTLAWGQNYRLQMLAETFNALQRTNAAFARSAALLGNSTAMIYDTYQKVASFQSPNGTQLGLRLDF